MTLRPLMLGLLLTSMNAHAWNLFGSVPEFVSSSAFHKTLQSQTSGTPFSQATCGSGFLKDFPKARCYSQIRGLAETRQYVTSDGSKIVYAQSTWNMDYINRDDMPKMGIITGSTKPKYVARSTSSKNSFIALYIFSGGSARLDVICPTDGKTVQADSLRECKLLSMVIQEKPESFYNDGIKKHDLTY